MISGEIGTDFDSADTRMAISSFFAGIGGALYAHYLGFVSAEAFTILLSIQFLAMVIIGGLGSVASSVLGTAFILLLPP